MITPAPADPSPRRSARGGTPTLSLFEREDPLYERADVGIRHGRVRRHGNLAPDADAALLHLFKELRLGRLVVGVLGRNILVRRADDLFVDLVADEAVVLFGELLVRRGRCGELQREDYGNAAKN